MKHAHFYAGKLIVLGIIYLLSGCESGQNEKRTVVTMKEIQITKSTKNHALDNNDNFSPDGRFLCYDTRGTVYNTDLANTKTIEKVEIVSGKETVLWNPPSVSGEQAAPGVAAVSWHPFENKVIFIHGPLLEEVAVRGYYDKPNRTGVEVMADPGNTMIRTDRRDVASDRPTTPGAHRGGTHRHEYSRNGKRIGFTYDDYLLRNYDRTIGYMELHPAAPKGYTHYFALLVRPVEKGKSLPGQIEKAYDDSWVDPEAHLRAFIAKIRSEDGITYDTALCVADIPEGTDITTADAGTATRYPSPPEGIRIHRLTHSGWAGGIVRGSPDGKRIVYLTRDQNRIKQAALIDADGSDLSPDTSKHPKQITNFHQDVSAPRWHPSGNWLFCLSGGDIAAIWVVGDEKFAKPVWLTDDDLQREELVVSPAGDRLAFSIRVPTVDKNNQIKKDVEGKDFRQIFVLNLDMRKIEQAL